jgi:hypothetical protein
MEKSQNNNTKHSYSNVNRDDAFGKELIVAMNKSHKNAPEPLMSKEEMDAIFKK